MESKPEQKINLQRRTTEEDTSSDSDGSLPDIECEICGLSFSDVKSYDSHLKGKKHHKKVSQAKFLAKHKMDGAIKKEDILNSDDDSDDLNEIHCEVCDKNFSGHISYIAHLKGKIHRKYVKKQKLKAKVLDMPGILNKDDNEMNEEDDGILQKPFARCSTCQKEFSGPEPFSSHMKSAAHKKKVEQTKVIESLKTKSQTKSKESDGEDDIFSNCDVCQKSFSGPVPYQIHMNSSVHKKNIEKMKVADEMKEYYSKDITEPGYVCNECKKVFIDPTAFKYHLTNNSHEKQKAKSALLGFLNAYPEIAYVTPFEENAEEENDSDSCSQDYYLICKICHFSFSGLENAEDHVKSKKHISVKKEKLMLKLLKERKKKDRDSVKVKDEESTPDTDVKINTLPQNSDNSVNGKTDELHTAYDFEMI